jgi:hypothetical protein
MSGVNFMQVVKCSCGSEEMCFCGRCVGCGTMRGEGKDIVSRMKKRWYGLFELDKKGLLSPGVYESDRALIDGMYKVGLLSEEEFAQLLSFCSVQEARERALAFRPEDESCCEREAPKKDESRLEAVESRLEALWTEVFGARVGQVGGEEKGDPKGRQTLRGAVLDLVAVNHAQVNEPGIAGDGTGKKVTPPALPWSK